MIREEVGVVTLKRDRAGHATIEQVDPRKGCKVWPRRSAEGEQGRVVLSGWNIWFPRGPIPADAVLRVRGKDYALFGNIADYGRKGAIAQCRSAGQS